MNDELKFTVISDIHYYSKKNFVDGFDKNKKPKPGQLFFSRSEEIVEHTFDCLCKNDTPDIVLISGDLTYNGAMTSHDEMKAALKKLQQNGKRVYVITATHDYTTPRMPTYGIDKNDKYIEVESVKRTQLLKYYGDFGYNNAIAKHKSTMSYVAQLADGYRLFALNDDYGDPDCGFSDELMNWVKTEANNAKRDGQYIIAMTHHPLVPPSPIYTAVAKGDMLNEYELRSKQLSDLGFDFVLTGHTHMHNISYCKIGNKKFYDISTAALTGFPPYYRQIVLNKEQKKAEIKTICADCADSIDTNGLALEEYTKDLFLGVVSKALYDAEYDYDNFADFAVGMSISKETSKKYKPIIHSFAKFLNHLTFGKVWHFVRFSSVVSKSEISKISSKKVVPFVINIAANLYRGDGNIPTSSAEYKMICSVLKKADRLAKPFGKKLNSIGLSSISEAVLPLVNRGADSDRNATVYFGE